MFWQTFDPKEELLMVKDEKFRPEKCRHSLFLKMREFQQKNRRNTIYEEKWQISLKA